MFGYSCECGRGTVRRTEFRDYRTKIKGKPVIVPVAWIGVCDVCGERCYSARELYRWRRTARRL